PEFSSDVSQEPFFSDAGRPVICILPGKNHTERYCYDTISAGCKEFNSHTLVKGSQECPEHFQLTVSILAKHSLNSSDAGFGNNAGKIKSEF
ncbi:MAG: hypothetical protein B6245_05735, partial [Desulfobacteraceae bacterium 4572_88]